MKSRDKYILKGIELLNERGVSGFSIIEVNRMLGNSSPRAPYAHFYDKEDLLFQILIYLFEEWKSQHTEILEFIRKCYGEPFGEDQQKTVFFACFMLDMRTEHKYPWLDELDYYYWEALFSNGHCRKLMYTSESDDINNAHLFIDAYFFLCGLPAAICIMSEDHEKYYAAVSNDFFDKVSRLRWQWRHKNEREKERETEFNH
ncbi:MAG: TetR/AcrR family transcriptional regulator [Oscillospiraceae bacterium]